MSEICEECKHKWSESIKTENGYVCTHPISKVDICGCTAKPRYAFPSQTSQNKFSLQFEHNAI